MNIPTLYYLPLWTNALLFLGLLLLALESSYRIGLWRTKRSKSDPPTGRRGEVVLTSMLGLLGLILAFTYSYTVSRSDQRKGAVLNDVNAIGTAFARADLLAEPSRTELRAILLDYARTRYVHAESLRPHTVQATLARMLEKQAPIWPATKRMASRTTPGPLEVSVIQSINEVLDAHTTRRMVAFDTLPSAVLFMLLFVACTTMAVAGYAAGRLGSLPRWRMGSLALALSAVMMVVTDFDRPTSGFIQVSQEGYVDLVADMEAELKE